MFSLPQDIDRNLTIPALNGKEFFLVEVIAHILHHLKDRLLTEVRDFGYKKLKASDIDWVITVPAIWESSGKKMMLEAGYMVRPKLKIPHLLLHLHGCGIYEYVGNYQELSLMCTCAHAQDSKFQSLLGRA